MTGRVSGKTAIVTGGAGGIAIEIARLFLAEGARVALLDRDADALEIARRSLLEEAAADRVYARACDIAVEAETVSAVNALAQEMGALDILVNNAAVRDYSPISESAAEGWQQILAVNVIGSASCARAALPYLRRSGDGCIVNVSSIFGIVGRPGMGLYDASKAALLAMTRTLANEEARHGVRVNAICPGSVLTDFILSRASARGLTEDELRSRGHMPCPMDRWGAPREIAYPVLWLASSEASFITGATLAVDGGVSAR